jgi:Secretion system C-terminal sorting domain
VMVKTRASTSFTSELKDFVAPFDFFLAPRANVDTDFPMICDTASISQIYVTNPIPTSVYNWTTLNGHIVGSTTGPFIYVDTPGVYIVSQQLQAACSVYATDTITIGSLGNCYTLTNRLYGYRGVVNSNTVNLAWKAEENQFANWHIVERSTDGINFKAIHQIKPDGIPGQADYTFTDRQLPPTTDYLFYRIRFTQQNERDLISPTLKFINSHINNVSILPNPVQEYLQLTINTEKNGLAGLSIVSSDGQVVFKKTIPLVAGKNAAEITIPEGLVPGMYLTVIKNGSQVFKQKIIIQKK